MTLEFRFFSDRKFGLMQPIMKSPWLCGYLVPSGNLLQRITFNP
jgi:hypothetical protein